MLETIPDIKPEASQIVGGGLRLQDIGQGNGLLRKVGTQFRAFGAKRLGFNPVSTFYYSCFGKLLKLEVFFSNLLMRIVMPLSEIV